MYVVLKQFIPGNDQIWVAKLDPNDPEYIYPTEQEAIDKANELQSADSTGRQYKVAPLNNI
jgi:hypothetical protein